MGPLAADKPRHYGQLSRLVAMESPDAVLEEVRTILDLVDPDFDKKVVTSAFRSVIDLFRGDYPGYQACNTEFHDLDHTSSVFLATARLIHGAVVDGQRFTQRQVTLGLLAAMFHDAGYIQRVEDTEGTGAKYTNTHVERSMAMVADYARGREIAPREVAAVQAVILCTNLSVDIDTIAFPDLRIRMLGQLLAAADVLAQMADRIYIEKLLFLYREFRESGMGGYHSELDLLRKTIGFFDFIDQRLEMNLQGVDRFMTSHFKRRWNIGEDLYRTAIDKQRQYLLEILDAPETEVFDQLKRGGITRILNGGGDRGAVPGS